MVSSGTSASQTFVPVKEIRDGVIVTNDGSLRMILIASSINIALKSAEEQESVILQFQNFLNSLDFSVQIFIQSRRYDIKPYVAMLEEREKAQLNDLLRIQTREYINFIKTLSERTNIMSKSFFVVVPYTPPAIGGPGKSGMFSFGKKRTKQEVRDDKLADFEAHKGQLEQRAFVVQQGLIRCGVRTQFLGTPEVIELLYKLLNPDDQQSTETAKNIAESQT